MLSITLILGLGCMACAEPDSPERHHPGQRLRPSLSRQADAAARTSARREQTPADTVPERPPRGWLISEDSVATLYSVANTVFDHPRMPGPYPRALVLVGFQPAATRMERQAAIDLVRGRVVGGMGLDYVVLIADDGTAGPLWAAVDALGTLPQVHHASPEVFTQGLVPPSGGPALVRESRPLGGT